MAKIERNDPLLHKLNGEITTELPRPYLGMSQLGNTCHRKLQYSHYWAFKTSHSARILRLFQVGHDEEPKMIADLAKVGIRVTDQQREFIGTGGHWKGHTDGEALIDGKPHLVEFKTHNDKSFKDLAKKKVKESKPGHYDQMQAYMGCGRFDKALYMALNKNDSTYYIEIVPFDAERYTDLRRKEAEVIMAESLLPKIGGGRSTWFECKMCDARHVCHKGVLPEVTCRSCQYVDVLDEGKWGCNHPANDHKAKHKELTVCEQREACDNYALAAMFKE